jgi:hypothetical protein
MYEPARSPGRAASFGPIHACLGLAIAALGGCGVKEHPIAVAGSGGASQPPGDDPQGGAPGQPATGGAGGGAATGGAPGGTGGTGGSATGGAPGSGGSAPMGSGGAGGSAADGGVPPRSDGPPAPPPDAAATTGPRGPGWGGPEAMGIPKEKIVVFYQIGHSNMAGRATNPASERPYFYNTDPRLWSFHGMDMTVGRAPFLWRAAKEPLSPDMETNGMAGPGMGILHAAMAIAQPDVYFATTGHGHSGMAGGTCGNYKKGGLLYEIGMAPARALKGRVTFGGIFTMLGTTERHLDVAAQNGFSACMAQVATDIRTDLGDPNIPLHDERLRDGGDRRHLARSALRQDHHRPAAHRRGQDPPRRPHPHREAGHGRQPSLQHERPPRVGTAGNPDHEGQGLGALGPVR